MDESYNKMTVTVDRGGFVVMIGAAPEAETQQFESQDDALRAFEKAGVPREMWEPEPTMEEDGTLIFNMSALEVEVVVAAMRRMLGEEG